LFGWFEEVMGWNGCADFFGTDAQFAAVIGGGLAVAAGWFV
jgi:hypothetical protein